MTAGLVVVEPTERLHLALRQEAAVLAPREEDEARVRTRRLGGEVARKLVVVLDREQAAGGDALAHLRKERDRHVRELVPQPLVRLVVQVLVLPEGREAAAVRETDLLADGVRAL